MLAVLLLLLLAAAPLRADVREGDWSSSPADADAAPTVVDNKKAIRPSLNITQPELQVETPTYLLSPTPKRKVKTRTNRKSVSRKATLKKPTARRKVVGKRKKSRRSRKNSRAAGTERVALEKWWEETGNPAVFVFRDCLNYHAVRLRDLAGPVPPQVQIAKAMDETCRAEFDHMASTIAKQFGEDGFEKLSEELIKTTFVPAATVSQ